MGDTVSHTLSSSLAPLHTVAPAVTGAAIHDDAEEDDDDDEDDEDDEDDVDDVDEDEDEDGVCRSVFLLLLTTAPLLPLQLSSLSVVPSEEEA